MYFKEQRYEKAKASTFASTHKVELPESGVLDSIALYLRATNSSDVSSVAPGNLWHHITKVEVLGNTDKKIFSLTGECAIAKAFFKQGHLPPMRHNEYNSKSQDLLIPIYFGKRYRDGILGLDLGKWDKVEVQVTNDVTTPPFVAASLSMETRLCSWEDYGASPAKFLKQWEYDSRKPAADKDYVRPKLPTSGLLRSLMIQLDPDISSTTAAVTADPTGDDYNWKLWFKDRSNTIYDHRPRDIFRDLVGKYGLGVASLKPYSSTTRYTDMIWADVEAVGMSHIKEDGVDVTVLSLEDSRDRYQKVAFAGTATFYQLVSMGQFPFHCFEIPFCDPDVEASYLDLSKYKPVEIEWYGYKDDNTHRTILEVPSGQGPGGLA